MKNYPYYEHPDIGTIRELLDYCAETYCDLPAFLNCGKEGGSVSFREFREEALSLGAALFTEGYLSGHAAILSENRYEWILSFFAAVCRKTVLCAINTDLPEEELLHTVRISDCGTLIYSSAYEDIALLIKEAQPEIRLLSMKEIPSLTEKGKALLKAEKSGTDAFRVSEEMPAAILFTSGTTGHPKAVVLTHQNLTSCMTANCRAVKIDGTSLLVLPLYHALGLTVSLLSVMLYGYPSFISSLRALMKNLAAARPRVIIAVPLFVEMFYKQIANTARSAGIEEDLLAMEEARRAPVLSRLRESPAYQAMLGSVQVIVCGGAFLDERYILFFKALGITILNGYGTTECSPVIATNRNECVIPGSVGFPVYGVSVRISDHGEVQVKGRTVMSGYYHNEEATRAAFTEDGWYRTGDLGFLDEDGALHLTGRLSGLIILSNGENIPAEAIEKEVYTIPGVKETCVYQKDNRIVAEIYPDPEITDAKTRIQEDIRQLNLRLPLIRNIQETILRDKPFEKTATKKIRRDYEKGE